MLQVSHDESLWSFSNGLPCSVDDVLGARSLTILRKILVDAPHSFVNKDKCHFETVWSFQWFAGAPLLLGAGVLSWSGVKHLPPECVKEFKPSLEEMSQKVIRVNLKRPLSQSVEKLPLPGVEKTCLNSLQISLSSSPCLKWSAKWPRASFKLFILVIRTMITCKRVFPLLFLSMYESMLTMCSKHRPIVFLHFQR